VAVPKNRIKNTIFFIFGLILISYPFLVYWSLRTYDVRWLALGLFALSALRWLWVRKKGELSLGPVALACTLILFLVAAASNNSKVIKLYPTLMNGLFFCLFATSLTKGHTPIVEKLARLKDKTLSPAGIQYTRKVTLVWCLFFIVNGGLCTYFTFCASLETWTLYTGFLSYILMGSLFAVEFLCRRWIQKMESASQ